MVRKVLAALLLLVALWIAAGYAVVALAGPFHPSGRFVDVGGRRLRLVCAGPDQSDRLVVWMEAGAWGLAADFAAVQQRLAERGVRSCAYDRAGLGFSDPGPEPRDSDAIAADLARLMAASGEKGPFVLVAHSMAGLHVRVFAGRHPDRVAGLVLVEAAAPQMMQQPWSDGLVARFQRLARAAAVANTLGLTRIVYAIGDRIGLPPQGAAEKKHAFVAGRHARVAAQELAQWRRDSEEAARFPLRPEWPVAVVVAGDRGRRPAPWWDIQESVVRRSRAGVIENDPAADHSSILGLQHNAAVVRGVDHVLAALGSPAAQTGTNFSAAPLLQ